MRQSNLLHTLFQVTFPWKNISFKYSPIEPCIKRFFLLKHDDIYKKTHVLKLQCLLLYLTSTSSSFAWEFVSFSCWSSTVTACKRKDKILSRLYGNNEWNKVCLYLEVLQIKFYIIHDKILSCITCVELLTFLMKDKILSKWHCMICLFMIKFYPNCTARFASLG